MFDNLGDAELENELVTLAGHIAAAQCRFLQMLAEFDARERWVGPGMRSRAHWLTWRVGSSLRTARDHLRVGHALRRLPQVTAAFEAGRLSYAKVRAITRIASTQTEGELVRLALSATASQVERIVRETRRAGLACARATAGRYLSWHWDEDGSLVLRARLPAAEGAALIAAVEETVATQSAAPAVGSAEPPGPPAGWSARQAERIARAAEHWPGAARDRVAARRADALMALAAGASQERYQVVVHLAAASGAASLEDGPALPTPTAERLACAGRVQALVEDERGNPLYLGRTRRLVRGRLLQATRRRDRRRCRFPGCDDGRHLHIHHLRSWLRGGRTEIGNVVHLCAFHHRLVHDRGYRLGWSGSGELTASRPDGSPVPSAGPPLDGRLDYLVEQHTELLLNIDSETITPDWHGERLDINAVLDALLPSDAA